MARACAQQPAKDRAGYAKDGVGDGGYAALRLLMDPVHRFVHMGIDKTAKNDRARTCHRICDRAFPKPTGKEKCGNHKEEVRKKEFPDPVVQRANGAS